MSEGGAQVEMGDEAKRHRIVPLVVGSLKLPDPAGGAEHPPLAMIITVDVDAVPGFREVITRQQGGEEFDINSRWASAFDKKNRHPPGLVLDFYLPEFDLGIAIYIDVDEYPDSIRAAIRTGRVMVVDPEAALRIQRDPSPRTLDDLRVITVSPPDASPAIGVLQQRFDFPRQNNAPERLEVAPENGEREVERFFAGARPLAGVGVQMRGDGLSVIVLIDSDLDAVRDEIAGKDGVEWGWSVLAAGEHSVLAFSAAVEGMRFARWLIADPSEEIVLAGSSGAHWVVLAKEQPGPSNEDSWEDSAIQVLIKEVEPLRALRLNRVSGADSRDDGGGP